MYVKMNIGRYIYTLWRSTNRPGVFDAVAL